MSLREPCEHGWYEAHGRQVSGPDFCHGYRTLTDAEALRSLLFDGDEPKDGVAFGSDFGREFVSFPKSMLEGGS